MEIRSRYLRHGAHEGVGVAAGEDEVKQGQNSQRVDGERDQNCEHEQTHAASRA